MSGRQVRLRDSLRNSKGKFPSELHHIERCLAKYSYTNSELDMIDKQLAKMPAYQSLIEKREKGAD